MVPSAVSCRRALHAACDAGGSSGARRRVPAAAVLSGPVVVDILGTASAGGRSATQCVGLAIPDVLFSHDRRGASSRSAAVAALAQKPWGDKGVLPPDSA